MKIETSISIFTVRWEQIEFEQHTIKAYPVTAHRSTGIGNRFCGARVQAGEAKGVCPEASVLRMPQRKCSEVIV